MAFVEFFGSEWRVIWSAPLTFTTAAVSVAGLVYAFARLALASRHVASRISVGRRRSLALDHGSRRSAEYEADQARPGNARERPLTTSFGSFAGDR
jgi:hypothetical protein